LAFDPWGMRMDVPGSGVAVNKITNRGYTGHEMDDEVGLINMNARIYDPLLGRFLSADPVLPDAGDMQAYNRYAYVLNNPLRYVDPTGNNPDCKDGNNCIEDEVQPDNGGSSGNQGPTDEIVVTAPDPSSNAPEPTRSVNQGPSADGKDPLSGATIEPGTDIQAIIDSTEPIIEENIVEDDAADSEDPIETIVVKGKKSVHLHLTSLLEIIWY